MPVTNVEYVLKESDVIVTKTDLKGKITYVNHDFIRISGFSQDELIGAPHNIVRHPDMPPEAFDDLWRTLKAGKAWSGLVKNRCKNGDFYWVQANAAPLFEQGRLVGYTSIRLKPNREDVAAADAAYRAVVSGGSGLEIVEGAAYRRSWLRSFRRRAALPVAARMALFAGLLALLSGAALALALLGMGTAAAWCSAAGIVAALAGCWLMHAWTLRPLGQLRAEIEKMSAGDLSARIDSQGQDELAALSQALRVLQTNVRVLVGQIKEATTVVTAGTVEIAHGHVDLSARSEAAASALEQTAASMEQLTGTVRNNADNAQDAHRLVGSAAQIAREGGEAVHNVVGTMNLIEESSRRIVDIIGVIDSIAFQTNILALNAAVEAARAGEQGRGFAVVAAEVRALAQRSASAAREVKALIAAS
ncbi:MAG TPA: methyl-accepting chemotaxis protein, partial [Telluria sp.]|nr:methyl-accepting chemotaxis protein [Telluria sp.]